MATLLSICQRVARKVRIPVPTLVAASSDQNVLELFEIAKEECEALAARHKWQELTFEATFTTVATESQGAITSIATDGFDYIIEDTMFDRSKTRPSRGPMTSQQYQREKAYTTTSPFPEHRILNGNLLLYPAPAAGQTYAFEYKSKNYCTSAGGTAQGEWAADDDIPRLDENLIRLGMIWRWKATKGFAHAVEFQTYEQRVEEAISRDGGMKRLSMAGSNDKSAYQPHVSEGSWNLS